MTERPPNQQRPVAGIPTPGVINASTVAEMAGVKPSAVSNWRRRHPDFPDPVAFTPDGSDLFDVREIQAWLRSRGHRFVPPPPGRELWLRAVTSKENAPAEAAVIAALEALGRAEADDSGARSSQPRGRADEPKTSHGEDAAGLAALVPADAAAKAEAAEYLVRQYRRARRTGVDVDSQRSLADFLLVLARPLSGTVVDPAAGLGTLLLTAHEAAPGVQLIGEEKDEPVCDIARLRLAAHGVDADLRAADGLAGSTLDPGLAETVLCDAPVGYRTPSKVDLVATDPRWVAGHPGRNSDLAWLQHAASLARANGGRAYVATGIGATSRDGHEARVRAEMLRLGMVEAIIGLAGTGPGGRARPPRAIWVLRPAADPGVHERVLLVNAEPGPPSRAPEPVPTTDEIASLLADFRVSGSLPSAPQWAVVRSVLDLMKPGAVVRPAHWVDIASGIDPSVAFDKAISRLEDARAQLAATPTRRWSAVPTTSLPPRARIGDLIRDGRMEVIRGARIPRDVFIHTGTPVVGVAELRDASVAQRFVPAAVVPDEAPLTKAGDVLLAGTPGGARVRMEHTGGRLLLVPAIALRIHGDVADPRVLAGALQLHVGQPASTLGVISRKDIEPIEIPVLGGRAGAHVADALRELDEEEAALRRALDAIGGLRSVVVEGAVSGALLFESEGSEEGEHPLTSAPSRRREKPNRREGLPPPS